MRERIAVAMSGGVDSSTVAALLVREGYECVGLTMQTWPAASHVADTGRARGCCSVSEIEDAEHVAWRLGIPHYTLNIREKFEATVVANFVEEYAAGRTPNPCVRCNQHIKFSLFLERARALGATRIATGHYARIERDEQTGRLRLERGVDRHKDQSYVLAEMTQDQLTHAMFPLGSMTKEQTREAARACGLRVAEKRDSVEICFLPHGNHGEFVAKRLPDAVRPGPVVDLQGNVLGQHRGLPFYTVGQRRGLGLGDAHETHNAGHATGSSPPKTPLFVIRLDAARNEVVVGPVEALEQAGLVARNPNWISIATLLEPLEVTARIRYNAPDVPATIRPRTDGGVDVTLATPARGIAPGQAVVFYQGDVVVGGATID